MKNNSEIIINALNLEDFSSKNFISALEMYVNPAFVPEAILDDILVLDQEKQALWMDLAKSCIYALAHYEWTDGRNEYAAEACRMLQIGENPYPEVGERFLRMHPTLQQKAMRLFGAYLVAVDDDSCRDGIERLNNEIGEGWYRFPLI